MKISLNWLKSLIELPESTHEIAEILTSLGLEVEGIEEVGASPIDFKGIVIGRVLTCAPHPDADRLKVTTVDIGAEQPLHIVCGAPNVATGQTVAVATQGAKVLDRDKQPFTIKKGKIRGVVSEGMICAIDELGLGSDHSGIWLLPDHLRVGQPLADVVDTGFDTCITIGLTPNRSDAMSHVGVARDLAAALSVRHNKTVQVVTPHRPAPLAAKTMLPIQVEVLRQDLCKRYSGIVLTNIRVAPSPDWLQQRLQAVGIRPINNVVDATNYTMLEWGQPLHAFDYDRIQGAHIKVQCLPATTPFVTLDNRLVELAPDDLVICDGADTPLCIAGVYGGASSGVTADTTTIFLESANFNPKSVRLTAQRHQLRTESAIRFEKGIDAAAVCHALEYCSALLAEIAGARRASDVIDHYPVEQKRTEIVYRRPIADMLIGHSLPPTLYEKIFAALDFTILEQSDAHWLLAIPGNKSDVQREADVTEEVLRVYGYNNVPAAQEVHFAMPAQKNNPAPWRMQTTRLLNALGWHEAMCLSLTDSRQMAEWPGFDIESCVFINNTTNQNLDILRPSLLPGLLESLAYNINRQQNRLRFFEFGNRYQRLEAGSYTEQQTLALVMTGPAYAQSWLQPDQRQVMMHDLLSVLQAIAQKINLPPFEIVPVADNYGLMSTVYIQLHGRPIGYAGRIAQKIARVYDVKQAVWAAELQWDILVKTAALTQVKFKEISKFPTVYRDIALILKKNTKFADVERVIRKAGKPFLRDMHLFDVYVDKVKLGPDVKSYALSLSFESVERTLQDADLDQTMARIENALADACGATVRRN